MPNSEITHYVCPVCLEPLEEGGDDSTPLAWCCVNCHEVYALRGIVPVLVPAQAYQQYPIQRVQDIYDRAYSNPGIMGTQVDPQYSAWTKQTLLSLVSDAPNPRILDMGTGDGDLWQFAPANAHAFGVDLSAVGITRAKQRFPAVHAAVAVSESLPYRDGYFGAVIAADTIEHAFDLDKTVRCIRRVLAPEGIFAFSVPSPHSLRKWGYNRILRGGLRSLPLVFRLARVLLQRTLLFGNPVFQPIDRDLTPEDWQHTLEQAGFRVAHIQEWPEPPLKPIVTLIAARIQP